MAISRQTCRCSCTETGRILICQRMDFCMADNSKMSHRLHGCLSILSSFAYLTKKSLPSNALCWLFLKVCLPVFKVSPFYDHMGFLFVCVLLFGGRFSMAHPELTILIRLPWTCNEFWPSSSPVLWSQACTTLLGCSSFEKAIEMLDSVVTSALMTFYCQWFLIQG